MFCLSVVSLLTILLNQQLNPWSAIWPSVWQAVDDEALPWPACMYARMCVWDVDTMSGILDFSTCLLEGPCWPLSLVLLMHVNTHTHTPALANIPYFSYNEICEELLLSKGTWKSKSHSCAQCLILRDIHTKSPNNGLQPDSDRIHWWYPRLTAYPGNYKSIVRIGWSYSLSLMLFLGQKPRMCLREWAICFLFSLSGYSWLEELPD